jgi:hypothetical protein
MPSTVDATTQLQRYAVPGHLVIAPADEVRATGAGVRSYLADGRGVTWNLPDELIPHAAIDAELATQPVTSRIARRTGSTEPEVVWPRWTRCEVVAKLLDLPVLSWLDWPGLIVPGELTRRVVVEHVRLDDVLVCCGMRRTGLGVR